MTVSEWRPTPRQEEFLASSAYEVLYGGAAGGGKSAGLLSAPLRWIGHPQFRGILFRRTFPDLERSLIQKSREFYPLVIPGCSYNEQKHIWRFPSGASIEFGHLEYEKDVAKYDGSEYCFLGFDELTHFTEKQYIRLLGRNRSSAGLPARVRATTNPGGEGHEWVFHRWGPWLDPKHPVQAQEDEILFVKKQGETVVWSRTLAPKSLARQFIPAKLSDNPHLTENDPEYETRLEELDKVRREQLKNGDWLIKPGAGLYFKREFFPRLANRVRGPCIRVRFWDRAATVDGDYTVGLLMAKLPNGKYVVEHIERFRGNSADVERRIVETAEADGKQVQVWLTIDPAQAGKFEFSTYQRVLAGFTVRGLRETGDKITRAGPVSSRCEHGQVAIVIGEWNNEFFSELEAFPEGKSRTKKDQVDALSGAYTALFNQNVSAGSVTFYDKDNRSTMGY